MQTDKNSAQQSYIGKPYGYYSPTIILTFSARRRCRSRTCQFDTTLRDEHRIYKFLAGLELATNKNTSHNGQGTRRNTILNSILTKGNGPSEGMKKTAFCKKGKTFV